MADASDYYDGIAQCKQWLQRRCYPPAVLHLFRAMVNCDLQNDAQCDEITRLEGLLRKRCQLDHSPLAIMLQWREK